MNPFRVYEPSECGDDGYPLAWHGGLVPVEDEQRGVYIDDYGTRIRFVDGVTAARLDPVGSTAVGVKHIVRMLAGHRCVRCLHPFVCGKTPGEWSPCDERCVHASDGSVRVRPTPVGWGTVAELLERGHTIESRCRVLTVHHLRLGSDAKRDLRWWNLAALCQRCHLQIQGKVVMERVWPWPHSEWFKPYAAGWYAHAYLGEDLSREETLARLDELLGLELAVVSPDRSADA